MRVVTTGAQTTEKDPNTDTKTGLKEFSDFFQTTKEEQKAY